MTLYLGNGMHGPNSKWSDDLRKQVIEAFERAIEDGASYVCLEYIRETDEADGE